MIDRIAQFYAHENSNIHRAAHELAARATDAYEGARETVRRFINAPDVDEVIFVRGTTEAINLVAKSWGAQHIGAGDEIIVSHLEHHAMTFEKTVFQPIPNKFEAGTGNIADAVGLGAALDYVNRLGIENIARYEHALLEHGMRELAAIRGVRLIGTAADKASVMSFVLAGYSTQEVGAALNEQGIAVRTGHHCAQLILRRFGVETTVRPSLAFYNTTDEIDRLVKVVRQLAGRGRAI